LSALEFSGVAEKRTAFRDVLRLLIYKGKNRGESRRRNASAATEITSENVPKAAESRTIEKIRENFSIVENGDLFPLSNKKGNFFNENGKIGKTDALCGESSRRRGTAFWRSA
jgi:hypothetical protein